MIRRTPYADVATCLADSKVASSFCSLLMAVGVLTGLYDFKSDTWQRAEVYERDISTQI